MRETPRTDRETTVRNETEPFHTRASEVTRPKSDESVGELLRDLTDESRALLRKEVELARVEISESVQHMTRQITSMAVGGAVIFAGMIVLLMAISAGATSLLAQFIAAEVAVWLGPLIVAAILAVVGYSMIQSARTSLAHTSLTPDKAIDEAEKTRNWAKEKARHG